MPEGVDNKRAWVTRVLGVQFTDAPGSSGPIDQRAAAKRCLGTWIDAREAVDAGLSQLQSSLRATKDPVFLHIADRGLNGITGRLQVGLRVGLEEFARETDPSGGAAQRLARSVEALQSFLDSDPAVQLCDENPFDVDVSLRATLGQALRQINQELHATRT